MKDLEGLIVRAESLLGRLEQCLPMPFPVPDWSTATAFRWRKRGAVGFLQAVPHIHRVMLDDLKDIDEQKRQIDRNTRQFVAGRPANNVLLTGARGTGKSSLVKALLNTYADQGLRLIEVDKGDLVDLPDIAEILYSRPERFIIYCDDLSFESDEPGFKALKVALDGTISGSGENVLVYATSNRRHLMPEYIAENLATNHANGEVHPAEATEEKIALSERFGLWLSFYPFDQDEYLDIVMHWLQIFGSAGEPAEIRREALQWALSRGSRSGRVAWQFARDWSGRHPSEKT